MPSIMDYLSGNQATPMPQKAEMPQAAKEQLQNIISTAQQSPEQFAQQSMQGVEQGMGMLGGAGTAKEYAQTGIQPGQLQALRNVYSTQTGKALEQMKAQGAIQAEQKKMQKLQLASQLALHQANTQTNYLQNLTDAYNQMEAQRAALVGALSGVASQGMGMYFGARAKGIGNGNFSTDASLRPGQFGGANQFQSYQSPYLGTIGE